MSDQADQTIVVRYVVEAQDAIAKHQELRTAMLQVKTQIKELAAQTGASYKQMSEAMVKAFSGKELQKAANITKENPLLKGQAFADATTKINAYKAAMSSAMSEIGKEVQNTGTIWTTSSKNIIQQQRAEAEVVKQAQKQEQQAKREATQAWLKDNQQQANAMKYLAQESKTNADKTKSSFSAITTGIAAALGISAINMVRNFFQIFTNYAQEAIQSGYEFAKGMFQLEVGVNALRRAGTDITFGDVLQQLKKLKTEFGIFSTKELVVGASAFLNLNRDMGFTKEQLFSLQEAIATLAVVNGRAMDEVQKTVALALSSGYTEGLQRLGVSINRVTIAEEAARLGWDKGYTALTEQQRALATYNLVIKKTAIYMDDLLKYQNTLPGAIDTTTAAIVDATAETGKNLLGLKYLWSQVKLATVEYFNSVTKKVPTISWLNLLPAAYSIVLIYNWIVKLGDAFYKIQKHWEALKNAFSEVFIVPLAPIFELISKLVTEVKNELKELAKLQPFSTIISAAKTFKYVLGEVKESLGGIIEYLDALWKLTPFGFMLDKASDFVDRVKSILAEKISVKSPEVAKIDVAALTDDQLELIASAGDKILDLQTDYDNDRRDMEIDLQRDLAEIEADGAREIEDIMASHAQKMLDITNKASEQIAEAQIRYDLDVQQAWDTYYSNLASAAESHSNKLLKIEEDYQEKLKRIKEGFLMDMEDALQARDARQVLKLIRQYNLDRTQAKRERDGNLKDEERAYQEKLHELDRQRRESLKKLKDEFRLRTEAIIRQRDRELDLEVEKYNHQMARQREENQRERDERLAKNKQDLAELKLHLDDRMKLIAEDMAALGITTAAGMQAVVDAMNAYIGPGGAADSVLAYFVANVQTNIANAMGSVLSIFAAMNLARLGFEYPTTLPTDPDTGPHAKGGMEYANKPTTAIFGEAGPELALFLPMSGGIGSLSSSTKAPVPDMKQGDKGKLMVEVLLGAGLEGRIIDKTLNNVASVILRSMRQ